MIYANPALLRRYAGIEDRIREHAPGFTTEHLRRQQHRPPVSRSGCRPAASRQLRETVRTQMVIGGRTFDVVTSPIFSETGERLGWSANGATGPMNWPPRPEVQAIVGGGADGDFSALV